MYYQEDSTMKVAISKASGSDSYLRYAPWLMAADTRVEIVDLHGMMPKDACAALRECSGLVLSGGPDVAPERYEMPELRELCGVIDEGRDAVEFALVECARESRIPTLGICRGAQLLNVAYGGTLTADIPQQIPAALEHRKIGDADSFHSVHVESGSILKSITRTMDGSVNSAHHQAVDRLASIFTPSARSADGVIEAFEWGDATLGGKPFLLAVQWHPERMDYTNPFSLSVAQHFLYEVDAFASLIRR